MELICVDDKSDATTVAGIYEQLLSEEKVDLLLGGYGNNSITPAMPLVMENRKFLIGLMALGENIDFAYDQFFAMIPTGTDPNSALTEGFFATAAKQTPRPTNGRDRRGGRSVLEEPDRGRAGERGEERPRCGLGDEVPAHDDGLRPGPQRGPAVLARHPLLLRLPERFDRAHPRHRRVRHEPVAGRRGDDRPAEQLGADPARARHQRHRQLRVLVAGSRR